MMGFHHESSVAGRSSKRKTTCHEVEMFRELYPGLSICGKSNDMFRSPLVCQFIKKTQYDLYTNMKHFFEKLVDKVNRLHQEDHGDFSDFYTIKETPSYLALKCSKHAKCRFGVWFNYEQGSDGRPVNIRWSRTINLNH